MPTKIHRLRHANDIQNVYRSGKRTNIGGLFLSHKENNKEYTRVAIIIGKKFSLSAVKRNRQRRVIRATLESIGIPGGYDITITYNSKGKMLSYKDITSTVSQFITSLT